MQAFLNRLRPQSTSQRHSQQSPLTNADVPSSSATGAGTLAQPEVVTPTETQAVPYAGIRKIAPNQDALLASSPTQDSQQPATGSRRAGTNELGVRVPAALARVANRKITPTTLPTEATIRESGESEGSQPIGLTQPPEDNSTSRRSFGLSSIATFTTPQTWSTFGRSKRDKQLAGNTSDDKTGLVPTSVSRTSSQSRTPGGVNISRASSKSTPNRTLSTKSGGGLSRSNSTTKQPLIEHRHSRTLSTSNENNDSNSPQNTEGGTSPTQEQKGLTPSTTSSHPLSIPKSAPTTIPHQPIDSTYPPRSSAAVQKEEQSTASSLPFTFGRQPPTRPPVEDVFISEFGSSNPTEEKDSPTDKRRSSADWASKAASTFGGTPWSSKEKARLSTESPSLGSQNNQPFPILETTNSEGSVGRSPDTSRALHLSGSSTGPPGSIFGENAANDPRVPSLVGDPSNIRLHSELSSSSGIGTDIPLRNMASFASSGDETTNPQIATSSWVNSNTSDSRFEFGVHTRETTADESLERTRSASGSSSGRAFVRRTSSAKRLNSLQGRKKSLGSFPSVPPITVYSANTTLSSQAFPVQETLPVITTSAAGQATSQQASESNQDGEGASRAEAARPASTRIEVPPILAVTAPTPRPSPARSHSNRLSELFLSPRVPDGHAHASGIGVAGVETRNRQQSIKVMGKRKAGDGEPEDDPAAHDDGTRRPRFNSNAPSSYHRKRMKLSSDASELDASPLRTPRRASLSGAPSIRSVASSRPGTGTRRAFSRNASSVSMPVSAILTPRAPSVHRPLSIASRSSGPHYHNPLRNRVQRRSKREDWIDSWTLDQEEMPLQAWLFLAGFLFPPCWWIAVLIPIERQEREKESTQEKGKGKDIEEDGKRRTHSASDSAFWAGERTARLQRERMWRFRCLMASIISTIIYIPIIVCAAVFARK